MVRRWAGVILGGVLGVLAGCASRGDSPAPFAGWQPPAGGRVGGLASALLFDRQPGLYDASEFAFRNDWPATDAYYSPGEVIFYTERFVDLEGRDFHDHDHSFRRFESVREGSGYR